MQINGGGGGHVTVFIANNQKNSTLSRIVPINTKFNIL